MPTKLLFILAFGLLQALYAGSMVAEPARADQSLWPQRLHLERDF